MTEINIKSTTIEKGLDLAKEFVQSVMKPSLDEVGELFADKVKLWRVKNQIRNIEKVKAIVEQEGIKTKAINMKVLFPYLDAVALEDDETLQDMWANLFVNYIDSEKNFTLTVYPEILRQISSYEAKILEFLKAHGKTKEIYLSPNSKDIKASYEEVANLNRLGLIIEVVNYLQEDMRVDENDDYIMAGNIEPEHTGRFYLSDFGYDFIDACTRDKQK